MFFMKRKPKKIQNTVDPQIVENRKNGIVNRSKSWSKNQGKGKFDRNKAKRDLKKEIE